MRLRVLRFLAIRNIEDKERAAAKAPTSSPHNICGKGKRWGACSFTVSMKSAYKPGRKYLVSG